MEREQIDQLVTSTAEIIGTATATTLGLLAAGPLGAYLGATSATPINNILKRLGSEITEHVMGPREQARISATFTLAASKISTRLNNGDVPRNDEFFDPKIDDRSSAETVLEEILQKSKNETEEKKIPFYSNFLCNLSFDNSIDFNRSVTYLKIIDRLSFQQLCIISYINDLKKIEFNNWNQIFINDPNAQEYLDFHFELVELFELNVLRQFGGKSLGGPSNGELSTIGKHLYKLMDLSLINEADKVRIVSKIDDINKLALEFKKD